MVVGRMDYRTDEYIAELERKLRWMKLKPFKNAMDRKKIEELEASIWAVKANRFVERCSSE